MLTAGQVILYLINCKSIKINCLLSTVYCLLPTVYCLLSTVYCLLSTVYCQKRISITVVYTHYFPICDFRNPNSPTPLGTNWPQYSAERGEYIGLSSNMTVRYKIRPNKMALWDDFLPSLGETVEPTTRSDVPTTTTRKPNNKKGITKNHFVSIFSCTLVILSSSTYKISSVLSFSLGN